MRLEEINVLRDNRDNSKCRFNYGNKHYNTGTGRGDTLYAFQDVKGKRYYLLSEWTSLPACGLEVFNFGDPDPVFEVFLQESAVEEALGKKGLDYMPRTIIRKLLEGWEG